MDLSAPALPRATDAARFAIAGRAPAQAWRPESAAELADAMRTAQAQGLAVVPWGGGVGLSRAAAPERYDVALDTSALTRIVVHDPEDFTVTAECGITLSALREALAAHGQELPLEAAEAWGATLGGVLACNASGARRRALGAPRDRLLGARFVTGDGVLARTGGRVVKNVAGHAVHRLLVGSQGALGVFAEASLKLLPLPMARLALVWNLDDAALADAQRWRAWPRREPAALSVLGQAIAARNPVLAAGGAHAVAAGWEDDPAWLAVNETFAHDALGASRVKLRDASVAPLWQQLADAEEMPGLRLTFTSAHVTPDAAAFVAHTSAAGRFVFHAACGRLHAWPAAEDAAAFMAEAARRGFTPIAARGDGAPQIAADHPELRQRLRAALDPASVLSLGRHWAGTGR